ncbi:MAG TPA: acetyltransferase [Thermoanaerobaculia bacterium]|nr:acetyltransferase [Thermoanaerobaculia bacterium]
MRALSTSLLIVGNTIWWGTLVLLSGVFKLIPNKEIRRRVRLVQAELADRWVGANNRIFDRTLDTKWDISGVDDLRPDAHYLIISNHASWVDIFALFRAFHRRAPFLRFFMKQQLIWFPIIGQACWAMDFPIMRRYSAEYVARHPEKLGKDLETTRIACRRYRRIPFAILNFLEGTRFTEEKHANQESPYRSLLRPRVGGIAFVLACLNERLDGVIDATIAYPTRDVGMLDFVTNGIPKITVRARMLDVPEEFYTDAIIETGPARDRFKAWIEQIWREKDELLGSGL